MRWTGRNPRRRVTVGQRPALQPLSSIPGDPALTMARGASYTTHFTRLAAILSGAPSLGDTAQLLLDQRVWGQGTPLIWEGAVWWDMRVVEMQRVFEGLRQVPQAQLAVINSCVYVCVLRPRQPSPALYKRAAWDSIRRLRAPSSGCLFPSECFTAQGLSPHDHSHLSF